MNREIDPRYFGLPPRTVVVQKGPDTIAIVMQRKSRIIMADGRNILAKAGKIRQLRPEVRVQLITTAPVCSKTRHFLTGEGIHVIGKPGP